MSDFQIAPADPGHLQQILQNARMTFEAHRARNPRAFPRKGIEKLERRHRAAINADTPLEFSVTENRVLTGYVLLHPIKDAGMIYDICVLPSFRQRGVGAALLSHAISIAETRRWNLLFASVWDGNDASHRLFQSANFRPQYPLFGKLSQLLPKGRSTIYSIIPNA